MWESIEIPGQFCEPDCALQLDDPLDAIAVHAWNGTWGVIAVGFFAGQGLITQSYGLDPFTGNARQYGCFLGGDGKLLGAQIIYALWLGGMLLTCFAKA